MGGDARRDGERGVRFAALRRLAAGALSGAVAKTAVAPFDRTKILMQVSHMYGTRQYSGGVLRTMRTIQRTEGARGFFRGNSATGASSPLSPFVCGALRAGSRVDPTHPC